MNYKLATLNLTNLTHLEAAELVDRLLADVGTQPQKKSAGTDSTVQSFLDELSTRLAKFQKALLRVQENNATQAIEKADAERDASFRLLRKAVKLAVLFDVPEEVDAARKLAIMLKAYRNVEYLNYEAETQAIDKLMSELEGTYAPQIELLGFGRYTLRLKNSNGAFKVLFGGRMTETALKETFDTRALRADLLNKYREFVLFIQVMANLPQADEYIQLLALVNTARKYYADMLARRQGMAQSNKEKEQAAN
jgi:hypothetical protein